MMSVGGYIPNMAIETTEAPPPFKAALNVVVLKGQRPKQFISEDELN